MPTKYLIMLILRSKATFVNYNAALQQARIRDRLYACIAIECTVSVTRNLFRCHSSAHIVRIDVSPLSRRRGMKVE